VQCETKTDQLMDLTMAVILNAPAVMLSLNVIGLQHPLCKDSVSLMDRRGEAGKQLSDGLTIGHQVGSG
jgi:hypothetical protein